jgi:ubiquitin conjugation factor E4 B
MADVSSSSLEEPMELSLRDTPTSSHPVGTIHLLLSRIFKVSYTPFGSITDGTELPHLQDNMIADENRAYANEQDLISQILMERLMLFHQMSLDESGVSLEESVRDKMVSYLVESYIRMANEDKLIKSKSSKRGQMIATCKQSIVHYLCSVLCGNFDVSEATESPLLPHLLRDHTHPVISAMTSDLVLHCHAEGEDQLREVFVPVLDGLRLAAQKTTPLQEGCHIPLSILANLCEVKLSNSSLRPVCQLVTAHDKWMPREGSSGRRVEFQSFMGPFLSLSALIEDSTEVRDRYLSGEMNNTQEAQSLGTALIQSLTIARHEMFRIVNYMLRCSETRDQVLEYLSLILKSNSKKSQLLADKRIVSSDGFVFNILFVMQQLNSKVKLSSVSVHWCIPVYSSILWYTLIM